MYFSIDDKDQPDFLILQDADRFHSILHSNDIMLSDATLVMVIFIVRRAATGVFDMFIIHKFFRRDESTNRTLMSKKNIPADQVEQVVEQTSTTFAMGLKLQGQIDVKWDELDLRNVSGKEEQIQRVKQWGKLSGVKIRE
jgi:hypothetical protein